MTMKQQSETVRDLTEPGWRERAAERMKTLLDAIPPSPIVAGSYADIKQRVRATPWAMMPRPCECREGECESKRGKLCRMVAELGTDAQ